jgi:hypothetical protein
MNDIRSVLSLASGEQPIWSDVKKTGFIHRKIVQVLAVTNYNIILWKAGQPQTTVPISDLSDVVVMDRKSTGSSHHYGYSYGSRRFRNYNTIGNYSSQQIGTIIFFVGSNPRLTWYGVSDPNGLKSLVNNLRKTQQRYV